MYPLSRTTGRLALRELQPADSEGVFAIYGNATATEHLSFEPRTREQVDSLVSRSIEAAGVEPRTEYAVALVIPGGGPLVGFGRLATDPHQPQAATMGFALHPDNWGVGLGGEAVELLLGAAFEDLKLHRVWGARSPLNTASARTMAAAGMVEEGVIREHVLKSGRWRDSVVHAILDHEWNSRLHRGGS